ncbi:MAG TPA: hypothetical protein ENJ14_01700 [Bacteroidetes bacterium]|nr:hypothetical protein [Bacteroidota bacterium]
MIRKTGILLGIMMMLGVHGFAQHTEAYARLERDSIMIGDQIGYELGINIPEGFVVAWPVLVDTISKNIEIVNVQEVDTSFVENTLILNRLLTITSFDSGYFKIPSYTFQFRHEGDTAVYEAKTPVQYLNVYTPVVDTSQVFKAIKGPIAEPYTFRELLPWILLGLLVVILVVGMIWYIRKRKKKKPLFAAKAKPELPPHIVAIRKLEELRLAKVWQQGKIKEYYTQLTDIVREYAERRYNFNAPEMTTEEILEELSAKNVNEEVTTKLKATLSLADLVKFAKAKPTPLENDVCLNNCIDFVQETKEEPVLRIDQKPESDIEERKEVE